MITSLKYYIVDVFAKEKFTGNQLAVVEVDSTITDEVMRKIARELGFRETSFLSTEKKEDGSHDVRIFTPEKEVAFSGHPTLGTAFIVNNFMSSGHSDKINLNLKSGTITIDSANLSDAKSNFISKKKTILLSEQKQPEFGHIFEPVLLSRVLGIDPEDIDSRFPIQEVTVGLGFIVVPMVSLAKVQEIAINKERYDWLVQKTSAKCIIAFSKETVEEGNDIHARVFAEYYNIAEDTASGSGNGGLAAYLAKYKYLGTDDVSIRVEQGYEIKRPSLIIAKAKMSDNFIEVSVGGRILLVAQGEIYL